MSDAVSSGHDVDSARVLVTKGCPVDNVQTPQSHEPRFALRKSLGGGNFKLCYTRFLNAESRHVWIWRCKHCEQECVPVRSSSFCICGHRQQCHTSGTCASAFR